MPLPRRPEAWKQWARWGSQAVVLLVFSVGVVVLLLWLAGKFTPKVPAHAAAPAAQAPIEGEIVEARMRRVPVIESASGSIRAVHETSIGTKIVARVMEVNVKAGQQVSAGDVLVRLDDTDLRAKFQQVSAALASAEAAQSQAAADQRRYGQLAKDRVVSQQEYERVVTALRSAEAEVRRATEAINEVQAMLDWATIRSPIDGVVIDKKVEVGDTAVPGQVLVTIFDPTRMQLVANVRESLAHRLVVGQDIDVFVEGLDKQCAGTISEIVPQSESASRAFQVKVTGPCPPGMYTGMFGRLLIPLDEEEVIVVPRGAVRRVGQLELVDRVENGRPTRRAVRTGRTFGDDVEILSGLGAGDALVAPRVHAKASGQEARHG
jgi:RND family efflux transporter MFP subunit